jgi:hypothetical protein
VVSLPQPANSKIWAYLQHISCFCNTGFNQIQEIPLTINVYNNKKFIKELCINPNKSYKTKFLSNFGTSQLYILRFIIFIHFPTTYCSKCI